MENPKVILFSILFLGGLYIIRWLISKSVNSAGNAIQKSLDKQKFERKKETNPSSIFPTAIRQV